MSRRLGVGLLLVGAIITGLVLAVLWPRNSEEGAAPTPVLIATQSIARPDQRSEDVLQLGRPATLDWPVQPVCPASLASECAGRRMNLVATVNLRRPSVVNGAFIPDKRLALCRWPVNGASTCKILSRKGALATVESAMYSVAD